MTLEDKNKIEWSEEEIYRLPINLLEIMALFLKEKKRVITTEEISKALGRRGHSLGGSLAAFGKFQHRESLLLLRGKGRYILNPKYKVLIEKTLPQIFE